MIRSFVVGVTVMAWSALSLSQGPAPAKSIIGTSLGSHIGPHVDRTISYKSVDAYTVEIVQRQDGNVVSVSTRTISRDGKTMTERFDYTNTSGQRVTNVLVFEKQ